MKPVFYVFTTFFFLILQTVVLPEHKWFDSCFDLQLINIIYLSLQFSHYSLVFAVILIGCIMDSLSGAPFFYYTFSYIWVWGIVQMFRGLVFAKSVLFIAGISIVSILIEHVVFVFILVVQSGFQALVELDYSLLARQLFAGMLVIPVSLWVMNAVFTICRHMVFQIKKQIQTRLND